MAHIHVSEWLDKAKQVPVGQKRRVYHGAEMTSAMDVWNNEDSWSAYCHRCHTSGKVYKQFLQRKDESIPEVRRVLDTANMVGLDALAHSHPDKYKRVIKLLNDKGVSVACLSSLTYSYCLSDDRLVFQFKGVLIGRDCTGRSPMKWLMYYVPEPFGYVYLQGSNPFHTRESVIVTEDLFSAQKIRYYTGWSTMCMLGTNVKDSMLVKLMDKHVVIATDGDNAGDDGAKRLKKSCDLFGIPVQRVCIPDGLDPKDLPPHELIDLFKFLEGNGV